MKTLGKREAVTSNDVFSISKLKRSPCSSLEGLAAPRQALCRDIEAGTLSSLGQKADALFCKIWDTFTVGTSFLSQPTMLLLWLLERNRPFQVSHFRLRWAITRRICPSMDSANPHHIRGSPPPGLPQNPVWYSHQTRLMWWHWTPMPAEDVTICATAHFLSV